MNKYGLFCPKNALQPSQHVKNISEKGALLWNALWVAGLYTEYLVAANEAAISLSMSNFLSFFSLFFFQLKYS